MTAWDSGTGGHRPAGSRGAQAAGAAAAFVLALVSLAAPAAAASDGFAAFVEGLWPPASAAGVSRPVFDAAFKDVEPDLSLPDLELADRPAPAVEAQAEFARPPQDYIDARRLERLAAQGRELLSRHRDTLERIEARFGVDRHVVLAIWGRETAFGGYKPRHDAIRALATQAYTGRRKELFRSELIHALAMLEAGVPRRRLASSWAGAMGLTQFMPSEYASLAVDFDGDGDKDIWDSVPDALASAASQLANKGWVRGQAWTYEVKLPASADCALEGPDSARPLGDWQADGFSRASGTPFSEADLTAPAYLMMPAGAHGPAFLVLENFLVIKRYNMSDLYAVFVGNLADRIAGGGAFATPWANPRQITNRDIAEIQRLLAGRGHPISKIDGRIGSNTRGEIGRYQRAAGIKPDCWPSAALLARLQSAAAR